MQQGWAIDSRARSRSSRGPDPGSGGRARSGSRRRARGSPASTSTATPSRTVAREIGDQAFAVGADVADAAQVKAYTDDTVARWGKLDVAFNNAGINIPGVFHEVPDDVVDRTINVNVKGCIYGCRYAIPHMLAQGRGSLINTTSVNGLVAEPFLAIYATSKGAIVMLSKGIALDYAKQGIRCNALAPGWVDTPINYAHAEMLGGLAEVYATIDSFQPIGRPGSRARSPTSRCSSRRTSRPSSPAPSSSRTAR